MKRVAVGLRANGVSAQDCVALISPNDIYFAILADSIIAAGAIFSAIPVTAKHSEIVSSCDAAQIKWLFTTPQLFDHTLGAAKAAGIPVERIFIFDPPGLQDDSDVDSGTATRFSRLLSDHDETAYVNPNASSVPKLQVAERMFTSGTTGLPKAANLSHAAQLARVYNQQSAWYTAGSAKHLQFVSMHHVSGRVHSQRAAAGQHQMYTTNCQDPAELVDLIREYGISSALLPPRVMIALADVIRDGIRKKENLRSIQFVLVGGSVVPNEAMDAFRLLAIPVIAYGSTEAGYISTAAWPSVRKNQLGGYVGIVDSNAEVKIIDPETERDSGACTDGEICVRSMMLFSDYCNNAKASKDAWIIDTKGQHWFRTGDKGQSNANGDLWVTGRYKEIFKVATEEVAPTEVESTLTKHPGVKDAAIVATQDRDDERYNEVKAYVVKNEKFEATAQGLVNFVAEQLTAHKSPTGGVIFLDQIPRNAMRKVITRELTGCKPLPGSANYLQRPVA